MLWSSWSRSARRATATRRTRSKSSVDGVAELAQLANDLEADAAVGAGDQGDRLIEAHGLHHLVRPWRRPAPRSRTRVRTGTARLTSAAAAGPARRVVA